MRAANLSISNLILGHLESENKIGRAQYGVGAKLSFLGHFCLFEFYD